MDAKFTGAGHVHGPVVTKTKSKREAENLAAMVSHAGALYDTVDNGLTTLAIAYSERLERLTLVGAAFCPACMRDCVTAARELADVIEDLLKLPAEGP